MNGRPFAHVGIIVPTLEAGRDRLTELLDIEWNPVKELHVKTKDSNGSEEWVDVRVCLSVQQPGFELIEEVPGTPWVCNEYSNLHHIAFESDALESDLERFRDLHCPLERAMAQPAGTGFVAAYHHDALGLRIELEFPALGR